MSNYYNILKIPLFSANPPPTPIGCHKRQHKNPPETLTHTSEPLEELGKEQTLHDQSSKGGSRI